MSPADARTEHGREVQDAVTDVIRDREKTEKQKETT